MPSLEEILRKTKIKSEQVKAVHRPTSIATTDRPYSNADTMKMKSPASPLRVEEAGNSNIKETKEILNNLTQAEHKTESHKIALEKPATKWQQTDNKPTTNRQQTDNKVATKWQQSGNKKELENQNRQQSGNRTGNTTDNKVATKWQQTDNKVATNTSFSKLVGLQREIVIFVCHECKNSRSKVTEALTLEYTANSLKHSTGVVKTTIQRLEKKGFLTRVEFKNGRGGWSRYEVPDSIYHDVMRNETDNKVATKWQQSGNKVATEPATEPATTASSSSSNNIKTTTTGLGEEWNFEIASYARFGFTSSQLKQIASLGIISAIDVEQSLIEFSYDFDNNALPPIRTNKINFLMGLFRMGHSYVSESFKSEQEKTIAEMASRAEAKRKKRLEDEFLAWEANLSDAEQQRIVAQMPPYLIVLNQTKGWIDPEVKKWMMDFFMRTTK